MMSCLLNGRSTCARSPARRPVASGWRTSAGRQTEVAPQLRVLPQSTLVPGHRSELAQRLDAMRLAVALRRIPNILSQCARCDTALAVARYRPHCSGTTSVRLRRRLGSLIPGRESAIATLCRRIGKEADAVIVVAPALIDRFGSANAHVIGNGTARELLDAPMRPSPSKPRMGYAGTLTDRFDASFLMEVLRRLPDWSVELYGECLYRGQGSAPGGELLSALSEFPNRLSLHGAIPRLELADALDRAQVLIAPHRTAHSKGQDSMKLYDYAARGRPIVATVGAFGGRVRVVEAGVVEAATPADFAAAVTAAAREDGTQPMVRRAWADSNRWESRWPDWLGAAVGEIPGRRSLGHGAQIRPRDSTTTNSG